MQFQHSFDSIPRGGARAALCAALATALWIGAATPVRADSDFEDGFEDQLGRILAFEAVQAGKALLFQGIAVPVAQPAYYAHPAVHYAPPVVQYVPVVQHVPVAVPVPAYGYGYDRHRSYRQVKHHGHRHHRGRGHHDCD